MLCIGQGLTAMWAPLVGVRVPRLVGPLADGDVTAVGPSALVVGHARALRAQFSNVQFMGHLGLIARGSRVVWSRDAKSQFGARHLP